METKVNRTLWIMTDLDKNLYLDTISPTRGGSWHRFCYPALNKEAYEKQGWKPIKYKIVQIKD